MSERVTAETEKLFESLPDWLAARPAQRERLHRVLRSAPAAGPMSYEAFLDWADEGTLAEWVDGEVVMTSPASLRHQLLADFLTRILGIYVEERGLGLVLSAPFQVKLPQSGREPDVLFVANENRHRLRKNYLDGPADLVVEIVSPESIGRDRGDKYREYEQAGVPEYWLIDPDRQEAEFYRLDERGRYRLAMADDAGVYRSPIVSGFWLKVDWLWQDPLPNALTILRRQLVND